MSPFHFLYEEKNSHGSSLPIFSCNSVAFLRFCPLFLNEVCSAAECVSLLLLWTIAHVSPCRSNSQMHQKQRGLWKLHQCTGICGKRQAGCAPLLTRKKNTQRPEHSTWLCFLKAAVSLCTPDCFNYPSSTASSAADVRQTLQLRVKMPKGQNNSHRHLNTHTQTVYSQCKYAQKAHKQGVTRHSSKKHQLHGIHDLEG